MSCLLEMLICLSLKIVLLSDVMLLVKMFSAFPVKLPLIAGTLSSVLHEPESLYGENEVVMSVTLSFY